MKKSIAAMMMFLVLAMALCSCADSGGNGEAPRKMASDEDVKAAEAAFGDFVQALADVDMERVQKFIDTDSMNDVTVSDEQESDIIINTVFSNLDSEIVSSVATGEKTVTVTAKLSTVDITAIMGQCTTAIYTEYFADYAEGKISDEELEAKTEEMLLEEVRKEDVPTVTNQVAVTVKKTDEGWKVEMNSTLQNAISGGFMQAVENTRPSNIQN